MPVVSKTNLITVREAAEIAGVSRQTIFTWLNKGKLTPYRRKLDGLQMVDADELREKLSFAADDPSTDDAG